MMSGGCCGWGYSYWNCGWHGSTTVVYRGGAYYGNTAWRGAAYGPNGAAHYGAGYNSATGTYARGGTVSNGYGSASAGQAYNPGPGRMRRGGSVSNAYGKTSAGKRLQHKNRGLCIHSAEFQCLRELGGLDVLEERQHCILAAQYER